MQERLPQLKELALDGMMYSKELKKLQERIVTLSTIKVKLISYSQPTPQIAEDGICFDAMDLVAYCARVSNPSNQMNRETAEKLISYLIKHKHWSPLEMVSACLEITAPRDIARQILRHRSFSFQEFSQRYANPLEELSFTMREARLQDTKNRQNSIDISDVDLQLQWYKQQATVINAAKAAYQWGIENGLAKEVVRAVLPEGCTMSRMYMNGTLRSWIHYIELRSANGTQKEHIEVAQACAQIINEIFPHYDH